ncbi:putative short-chain dehydrogenases/reductase [Hypoxylon crocopeplum]|nr:putative short-chain dehydrogenases/reductase [Hypoxylon crocopeplum]
MVALSEVTASNERISSTLPPGLVAVFVGGTSGVGEYTVKKLAKYVPKPKVYIIGRSQEAADRIVDECRQLNPGGTFEFIKADVSLLKSVDDVCRQLKSKETQINILFQSQGSMGFARTTPEGLPLASCLIMHSRLRFILNLLPLLQNASSLRRVISVQAATCEGPIDLNNIPGQGFPLRKWRDQVASVQSLLLGEAVRRAPSVSFVHTVPGLVKSSIARDAEGLGMSILIGISRLVLEPLLQTPSLECGERHLFLATSAMYVPGQDSATAAGVSLEGPLSTARGSDGQTGSGMYSVDNKGESASHKVETLLAKFRKDGTAEKVWDYIMRDFKRITGTEVAA